jgi:hypothetical protein
MPYSGTFADKQPFWSSRISNCNPGTTASNSPVSEITMSLNPIVNSDVHDPESGPAKASAPSPNTITIATTRAFFNVPSLPVVEEVS